MDAEVGGKKEEIPGSRKKEFRQRSMYGILRMDVEEKDRMGKQKLVIINGEEERGNEKKPEKSQKKKYKTGTKTINLYMVSSLQLSSFFLLPTDIGLTSVTSSESESVAELPTDIGLTSVTSVTSVT